MHFDSASLCDLIIPPNDYIKPVRGMRFVEGRERAMRSLARPVGPDNREQLRQVSLLVEPVYDRSPRAVTTRRPKYPKANNLRLQYGL